MPFTVPQKHIKTNGGIVGAIHESPVKSRKTQPQHGRALSAPAEGFAVNCGGSKPPPYNTIPANFDLQKKLHYDISNLKMP